MSEKLLELSSVVNVLSRTVADLEKQRQNNETRLTVMNTLMLALLGGLTPLQRTEVFRSFNSASAALIEASTSSSRAALKKEIADLQRLLG